NERPKQGLDIVQSRLKGAKALNLEIVEYFKERVAVEDNYVKGLHRLANKTFIADKSNLGTFANVWDKLFNEVNELIDIHSVFIKRIYEEVETPLREKVISDPEWSQLKHYEINLSKLAREYEEKHAKINKKRSKTEKHTGKKAGAHENKLMEIQRALENTCNEWNESWSQFLEKSQAADMSRLMMLKEALVSFETIQAESYQKRVVMTEKTLNEIMDFDTQSEIDSFCSKKSGKEAKRFTQNFSESMFPQRMNVANENDGFRSSSNFQNGSTSLSSTVPVNEGGSSSTPIEPRQLDGISSNESLSDGYISASVTADNKAMTAVTTTTERSLSVSQQDNATLGLSADLPTGSFLSPPQSPMSLDFLSSIHHPRSVSSSGVYPRGLHATISETINVMSKGEDVVKMFVTGEISVSYNFPTVKDHSAPMRIRIKNFEALEKSVLNTSYMRDVPESSGLYDIDTSLLSLSGGAPVAMMKYQLQIDPASKNLLIPLRITPKWKCDPNLTLIMINYQANPECLLSGTLTDFTFIIPVDGKVESAQSNPTGIWNTENQKMYWKADDIDLSAPPEQKRILARFETKEVSKEAPVTVKFVCKGQLFSNISLEIEKANPEIDKFQEVVCQVSSGKFMALP
ncbi:6042_t:CDS:10, partial [Acaulospora morrowiae]